MLNEFISQFALDLPKFMNGNNKEKANTLLQVIGVGDKLYELDQKEKNFITSAVQLVRSVIRRKNTQRNFPFFRRLQAI